MRISDWSSDVCSSDLAAENSATGDAAISEEPLRPLGEAALPPLPPAKPADRRPVVVIDPGHGGVDPGAIGVSGIYEKNLTLDYGRALRQALEETGRYRAVMTRERDVLLKLRRRNPPAHRPQGTGKTPGGGRGGQQ